MDYSLAAQLAEVLKVSRQTANAIERESSAPFTAGIQNGPII